MSDKVVVIISSAEPGKARTGVMYALNAVKHAWLADVRLVFFGPAESLLIEDKEIQRMVAEFGEYREPDQCPLACKYLSDLDGTTDELVALGVAVAYVGAIISELIKQGYQPMVW